LKNDYLFMMVKLSFQLNKLSLNWIDYKLSTGYLCMETFRNGWYRHGYLVGFAQ
jgi:hypothetical protein